MKCTEAGGACACMVGATPHNLYRLFIYKVKMTGGFTSSHLYFLRLLGGKGPYIGLLVTLLNPPLPLYLRSKEYNAEPM